MSSPHIVVVEDAVAVSHAAFRLFLVAAEKAIAEKDSFSVALSGGSTPKLLFQLLAKAPPTMPPAWPIDWTKVFIYFADERCVAPDHADSNFKMANDVLLMNVPIPLENIFRMRGEIEPEAAAKEYGLNLKQKFGDKGLDLILLGMGDDGHTASLFPNTTALNETDHRCVAHLVEKSTTGKSWRITLSAPFINRASEIIVMMAGTSKAQVLKEVLDGPKDPQRLPIQLIHPAGQMVWIVDQAANSRR